MSLYSIGDLAGTFLLRRQNVRLNSELARLTQEMASGVAADIPRHLNGNYSFLGDLERGLRVNEGYANAAKEAAFFTGAMQSALEQVQQATAGLSSDLILSGNSALPEAVATASTSARGEFEGLVSAFNTNVAARALFSVDRTDTPPLAPSADILASIEAAIAGETTLSGVLAAIDDWFDTAGGGFETTAYLGSDDPLSAFLIGEGETVDLDLKADDQAIRDILKNTAVAALAADPDLGFAIDLRAELLVSAGENLLTSQSRLSQIRADLGYAEARIEESQTRLSAERTSLEIARGELLGVDLYETATRLENVQFQLESLYTATARLSGLSLVEFLR